MAAAVAGGASYSGLTLEEAFEDLEERFLLNLPASELESPERLCFQLEQAYWYFEDFIADRSDNDLDHYSSLESFADEMFARSEILRQHREQSTALLEHFKTYLSQIPVFGVILLNERMDRVLLVTGYHSKTWNYPKGKINQGEEETACAAREALEEVGYDASAGIKSGEYLEFTSQKGKKTRLYLVRNVPENFEFVTKTRKEIGKIQWHAIADLPATHEEATNKFWSIYAFTSPLRAWIKKHRKKDRSRPRSRGKQQRDAETFGADALGARGGNRGGSGGTASQGGWSVQEMFAANEALRKKEQERQAAESLVAAAVGEVAAAAPAPQRPNSATQPRRLLFPTRFAFDEAQVMHAVRSKLAPAG